MRFHFQKWRRWVRPMITFVVVAAVSAVVASMVVFLVVRHHVEAEWGEKFPHNPRPLVEVRGLLDGLVKVAVRDKGLAPAFIPQSMWDNERCASAVVNAVNFLLGEDRLQTTAAWHFGAANRSAVGLVVDRSDEFEVQDHKIVERMPLWWQLSEVLLSDRLYVLGYHFKRSHADPVIVDDGEGLNSHLVLAFAGADREWYGYHFFHKGGKQSKGEPFRVEPLKDLQQDFDLMYVWEIKDLELPPSYQAKILYFAQARPTFAQAYRWIDWGLGGSAVGYYVDTVVSGFFGWGEIYPRVVEANEDGVTVLVEPGERVARGAVLGYYRDVAVYKHRDPSQRGPYGREFQCVELVNRFYAQVLHHWNMTKTGDAETYYYHSDDKGLMHLPQGVSTPPQVGDILVFDKDGPGGSPGHVAIVAEVRDGVVCVVQQNTTKWYECLFAEQGGRRGWWVESVENLPYVGWVRKGR